MVDATHTLGCASVEATRRAVGWEPSDAERKGFQDLLNGIYRQIGGGDNVILRMKTFRHVYAAYLRHGDTVRHHVLDRWSWAKRAGEPGRAFVTAIVRRLQECGLWLE
jgi:hypothetical protein